MNITQVSLSEAMAKGEKILSFLFIIIIFKGEFTKGEFVIQL